MASQATPPFAANVRIDEHGRFIRINGKSIPRQNSRVRVDVRLNTDPPKVPAWVLEGRGAGSKPR